jgi:hypothetical protein
MLLKLYINRSNLSPSSRDWSFRADAILVTEGKKTVVNLQRQVRNLG